MRKVRVKFIVLQKAYSILLFQAHSLSHFSSEKLDLESTMDYSKRIPELLPLARHDRYCIFNGIVVNSSTDRLSLLTSQRKPHFA